MLTVRTGYVWFEECGGEESSERVRLESEGEKASKKSNVVVCVDLE